MKHRNLTAPEIAMSMGIQPSGIDVSLRLGVTARFGQYVVKEGDDRAFHLVDKAEVINAQRNRYTPHQGQRECARRVKQDAALKAKPQDLYFVVVGKTGRRVSKQRYLASRKAA